LSRDETPFADIDLNARPADVAAALSVYGPSRAVFRTAFPAERAEPGGPAGEVP
jgi:hypothetical protein